MKFSFARLRNQDYATAMDDSFHPEAIFDAIDPSQGLPCNALVLIQIDALWDYQREVGVTGPFCLSLMVTSPSLSLDFEAARGGFPSVQAARDWADQHLSQLPAASLTDPAALATIGIKELKL